MYSKEAPMAAKMYIDNQKYDANTDKLVYQCFQLLINKLLTACQGVPVCRIAVSNPGEDLSQLINKLQSLIIAWEKEPPS